MPRKPRQLPQRPALTKQIAAARYVGSPEHKSQRWWGGLPEAFVDSNETAKRPNKQDTTICTLTTEADRNRVTEWVQKALKASQFRYYEVACTRFRRHRVWCFDGTGGTSW